MINYRFLTLKSLIAAVALMVVGTSVVAPVAAKTPQTIHVSTKGDVATQDLRVPLGTSVILEIDKDVKDILIGRPEVVDAVVRTKNRIFLFGNNMGHTNLVLFGDGGKQLASFNVNVVVDTTDLEALIKRLLPNSAIDVETYRKNIILSGTALNADEAQRARDIALKFVEDPNQLLDSVQIAEKQQVQLRVTVAEVNRDIIKQLGVKFGGTLTAGGSTFGFNSRPGFNVNSNIANATNGLANMVMGNATLRTEVNALQRDGVVKMLAEPNLVAVSGETASFLAGGEFPMVVGWDDGKASYDFKQFGVVLDFVPVVLSGGRINMRIKTEVSELTQDGALSNGIITIQGLKVRRAESTVELPSGGTLVMAGLLKEDYSQGMESTPGLSDIPILGQLFKSRDFRSKLTELVIFVTPYIVRPVAQADLSKPTDNLMIPSDSASIFMDHLNRVYSKQNKPVKGSYHGEVGYIYE